MVVIPIMQTLRTAVGYVLVPIQSGVNRVGGGLYNELSSVGKLKTALAENETLKTRVDELTEENTSCLVYTSLGVKYAKISCIGETNSRRD